MTELTPKRKRGRPRKPTALHLLEGTFVPSRHGNRPDAPQQLFKIKQRPQPRWNATASSAAKWCRTAADEMAVRNGCRFDERLADHVVQFFRKYLRHSKGQWAGKEFELLDWQRDDVIFPLFGWINEDLTRRFRRVYIEVPKKNGKSTLASAIGLYLLAADGEAGAEVYSCATDRDQASIVHNEAINMVEASEPLQWSLNVNRTTRTIYSIGTKSSYRALSATPAGKEGLNIHGAIIDELHVWKGTSTWDALKYGYASRRQPIQFVITTAGADMQSICRQQHDRAEGVIRGDIRDDSFLGLIYAASPEADWQSPEVWRAANPSMGATIQEREFARDAEEAAQTPGAEAAFKRYRLNIWATSETPWLTSECWAKAGDSFSEEDFAGQRCWAGLDLATTHDMSALVLCFLRKDQYCVLPYFWLPETAAAKYSGLLPMAAWKASGAIQTTPGEVADYDWIFEKVKQLAGRFQISSVRYDPYNAEHLTQRIEKEIGIPRVQFAQTVANYATPTAQVERMLLGGRLRHPQHPVLTWQAGNCSIKTDANNNKRPVKPSPNDYRKIDGIVAMIMAMDGAMEAGGNVYAERGLIVL